MFYFILFSFIKRTMLGFLGGALKMRMNKYLEERDGKNRDASNLNIVKDMLTAKNGVKVEGTHMMPDGTIMKNSAHMKMGGMVKDQAHLPMRDYATVNMDAMPKLITNMANGGMVPTTHIGRPPKYMIARIPTLGVDQVPALLQIGELVIPKKHTPKVEKFLKSKGIKLKGMK